MMKNHLIKFLVDEDQFQRIRLNARARGHMTISSYLRDLSISRDLWFETMLVEIHKEVVKNGK